MMPAVDGNGRLEVRLFDAAGNPLLYGASNADGLASQASGELLSIARLFGYDPTGGHEHWDRVQIKDLATGNLGAAQLGLIVNAAMRGHNGTGWGPIKLDANNRIPIVGISNTDTDAWTATPAGIAVEGNTTARPLAVANYLHNGNTFDREKNNHAVTLLASAARTAATNSSDQPNYNMRGLIIFIDVTAITDTPVLTPKLHTKDSISGQYKTCWTAAANITGIGQYVYLFQPGGASGGYTEAVNLRVGRTWRFSMGVGDADSATYSVSADILA